MYKAKIIYKNTLNTGSKLIANRIYIIKFETHNPIYLIIFLVFQFIHNFWSFLFLQF